MIPAHTPATLTARIRRSPASLGSSHYYLEPGQAVRVLSATATDARCYCGQPEDSRISEDYFTVPLSSLQVATVPALRIGAEVRVKNSAGEHAGHRGVIVAKGEGGIWEVREYAYPAFTIPFDSDELTVLE